MGNWNNTRLNQVLDYEQPTKYIVETTDYDDSFKTPVLTAGKSFLLGHTDETTGIFKNVPAIIFDDFTTAFHYVDFPFKVKSSAMKILTANEDEADLRFLYYRMGRVRIDTELHKRYWISKFSKVEIPLPPLETQKRIAQILDDASEMRDKTQQLLKEYDLLAQSIFLEMFGDPITNPKGWGKETFEHFAIIDTQMTTEFDKYSDQPHIGIANIERNTGKLKNYVTVSEENLSSGKYIFDERHIIYSKIRPNLNKVALPTFKGLTSADSYPILVKSENSNRIFFAFLLRSKSFVDFILTHSKRTNIPKANKSQILKYKGIAPPVELQNQFAEKIALIEKQKDLAKQELKESEDLFNCLLQKAFNGELVN
ncbi:restriction endonuclease subunit S [Maribacter sp. 2307ULW6-5]|uniref:restriction endonuclease subunit S n=1 Tax=Maribacter sp. 2307ULW6-5 TaxID=3386275 RepID=UPI0039BCA9BC